MMQRLFSMFPAGLPGIALLLLRAGVAASLLQSAAGDPFPWQWGWPDAPILLLGVLLVLGLATPFAAGLSGAWCLVLLCAGPGDLSWVALSISNATALALIGPGAYSLDARLFGRRIVVTTARR